MLVKYLLCLREWSVHFMQHIVCLFNANPFSHLLSLTQIDQAGLLTLFPASNVQLDKLSTLNFYLPSCLCNTANSSKHFPKIFLFNGTESCYVALAVLVLAILVSQPKECWEYHPCDWDLMQERAPSRLWWEYRNLDVEVKKRPTLKSCPLICMCSLWHVRTCVCTHMHTHIKCKNILKEHESLWVQLFQYLLVHFFRTSHMLSLRVIPNCYWTLWGQVH